jgi:hypothetical protein
MSNLNFRDFKLCKWNIPVASHSCDEAGIQ